MCISSKLRLTERRQQRLQEVQAKRDHLCEELAETQGRLMVEPGRWLEQCECPWPSPAEQWDTQPMSCRNPDPRSLVSSFSTVLIQRIAGREEPLGYHFLTPALTLSFLFPVEVDPELEPESAEYLAALEQATAALEQCVNLCKAHVMMVTCFDIGVAATTAVPGPQEVDV